MKDRITQIRVRLLIQMFLWRNIRKWGRWQQGGMTEEEAKQWNVFLRAIKNKYGLHAEVPFYERAKNE